MTDLHPPVGCVELGSAVLGSAELGSAELAHVEHAGPTYHPAWQLAWAGQDAA